MFSVPVKVVSHVKKNKGFPHTLLAPHVFEYTLSVGHRVELFRFDQIRKGGLKKEYSSIKTKPYPCLFRKVSSFHSVFMRQIRSCVLILCKLDFGLGFAEETSTRRHHCKFRHRRTAGTCAGAARLALQPQQPRYLGEFAETAETPSIRLELPISATTLQAAASTQFPPAAAIPAHSTILCPPRGTHHIQAPSPLAQASVQSPFTLRKERTRKLQVPMGLAASTTTRLSSGSR